MSKEMHNVKKYLYQKYGGRCEVCGKKFEFQRLTGHHIIMKCKGGRITRKNILLACYYCHFDVINHIKYNSIEYWSLMWQSLEHREPEDKGNFPNPNCYVR